MKVTLERTAIAAGIGALDIATEEVDARQGYSKVFENATDITRTVLTVGSVAANFAKLEETYTDTVFYSSLPLFAKSLYRGAVHLMHKTTTVRGAPTAKAIVRVTPSSGLQPVVTPAGNFRSITA